MTKVTFVSPHLDDAVLSCGQLITSQPNCEVITICAGKPSVAQRTDYDTKLGFDGSDHAMRERQSEDIVALHGMGADHIHLNFLDKQYRDGKRLSTAEVIKELDTYFDQTDCVYAPLGLLHSDHIDISNAILGAYKGAYQLFLYEELPYRVIDPIAVQTRLNKLKKHKLELIQYRSLPIDKKIMGVYAYMSQINSGDISLYNVLVPERYWQVKS